MKFKRPASGALIFCLLALMVLRARDLSADAARKLVFPKHIVILDMPEGELRVTEILNPLNSSGHVVDLRENPLVKTLPASAFDIQYLGRDKFSPEISSGKIVFSHKVPPGELRLVFSYSLPVNGDSLSLVLFFPPATKELELISPEKVFEVSVEETGAYVRAISEKKSSRDHIFDSKTLILKDNQEQIRVLIKNIPLPQNKLFYPAAAVCVLIFLSLFRYLKRVS